MAAARKGWLRPFDIFMGINATALIGSTLYAFQFDELEFGLYAAVIFTFGAVIWKALRKYDYPIWMLAALQLAIVIHFAGGFMRIGPDGHSLYWHEFFGIRFDKIVHVVNSAVGVIVVAHIFREARLRLAPMSGVIVVLVVCGVGAAIEIIEYFAVKVIVNTGVGDYANTVEDLIMNLVGASAGWWIVRLLPSTSSSPSSAQAS